MANFAQLHAPNRRRNLAAPRDGGQKTKDTTVPQNNNQECMHRKSAPTTSPTTDCGCYYYRT
eukprot:scaffold1323_cov160-Amphora_coffeaeformis.AAC.3